jgi:hypothetical protein
VAEVIETSGVRIGRYHAFSNRMDLSNQLGRRRRNAAIVGASAAGLLMIGLVIAPPILQDPAYHAFADGRTLLGIPNFWNVISNLPFLLAAVYGAWILRVKGIAFTEAWERTAYWLVLVGTAAVSVGSSYYHLHPDNGTLFWDRLPMTVVFMSLVATTIGERVSMKAGKLLLIPLLLFGVTSVLCWQISGDLRLYVLVQFGSILAMALMVALMPARYDGADAVRWTVVLYGIAKLAELFDHQIATVIATGGHPWKHLAAACAIGVYINALANRRFIVKAAAVSSGEPCREVGSVRLPRPRSEEA